MVFTNAEHIQKLLHNNGVLIADVAVSEGEQIVQMDEEWKAHSIALNNIRKIDAEVIKELMEQGADIHVDNDYASKQDVEYGRRDVVKFLVEQGPVLMLILFARLLITNT